MTETATTETAAASESGPRYAQIQKTLENRVIDGTYAVGTLIPTEIALVEEFDASRTTIREALRYLRERGYVERRQGVGTRVISNTSRSAFSQSFSSLEELFQVAAETFFVILEVKDVELAGEIADQVGGNAGEIWKLVNGVRWSEPGGKPLAYVQCYVPKRFESIIPEFHDAKGPFFAVLERRSGWAIEEVVQEIRAVPMPSDMERHLGLRSGAWALQLLRRYVSEHGVLISSYNWHPADQMAYVMRIQRDHERGD